MDQRVALDGLIESLNLVGLESISFEEFMKAKIKKGYDIFDIWVKCNKLKGYLTDK